LQSKAQNNLQSLGENKTGYRTENIDYFPQTKTSIKSTFVYTDFYTLLIMHCYAKQCQFATNYIYNLHVMLLLVIAMSPGELCQ